MYFKLCVGVCVWICACAGTWGVRRRALELELKEVVSCPTWVLGIELCPLPRATHRLLTAESFPQPMEFTFSSRACVRHRGSYPIRTVPRLPVSGKLSAWGRPEFERRAGCLAALRLVTGRAPGHIADTVLPLHLTTVRYLHL